MLVGFFFFDSSHSQLCLCHEELFTSYEMVKDFKSQLFQEPYRLSPIWQGKKEIETTASSSQSQEYWSSPCSHWDTEYLYSEHTLLFLNTPVRWSATKLLGVFSYISLMIKYVFVTSSLPGQKSCQIKIPFCSMPWFQGDSTFQMRNLK